MPILDLCGQIFLYLICFVSSYSLSLNRLKDTQRKASCVEVVLTIIIDIAIVLLSTQIHVINQVNVQML
jgi:uncharacterized membrane protein YhaH (DUF805 family)